MERPAGFMIIGAQKCGTTTLAAQLAQHPDVRFCRVKEPHFFSRYDDWRRRLPRYHRLFPAAPGMRGEASTSYSFVHEYPETPRRLRQYNPDLRLILMMRHPLDRIRSHLRHDVLAGRLRAEDVAQVALADARYADRSRFASQLQAYLEQFPAEQILPLLLENVRAEPIAALAGALRFLGLDAAQLARIDTSPRNISATEGGLRRFAGQERVRWAVASLPDPCVRAVRWLCEGPARRLLFRPPGAPVALPAEVEARLWEQLAPEVRWLESFLGRDLSALWRPPATRPPAQRADAITNQ